MYDINKLIKVSTYARSIKKSTVWIYGLIEKGELKSVKIDGVVFINLDKKA